MSETNSSSEHVSHYKQYTGSHIKYQKSEKGISARKRYQESPKGLHVRKTASYKQRCKNKLGRMILNEEIELSEKDDLMIKWMFEFAILNPKPSDLEQARYYEQFEQESESE